MESGCDVPVGAQLSQSALEPEIEAGPLTP